MVMTIDAHHHFWETAAQDQPWRTSDHSALERDFGPADLTASLDESRVDATILVQSVDEPGENRRLARYAESARVAGVIASLALRSGPPALLELEDVAIPKLRGVRCLIADDPLEWIDRPPAIALFKEIARQNLSWDVVPITPDQVRAVVRLAQAVPKLRIIVDHLGRPPVEASGWEPWASYVRELAACPNIAMKISVGINTLTSWPRWEAALLERYVGHACEEFGSGRLMLASNWPVILLRTSYAQAWADLSALVELQLPDAVDRARVMGQTATRWYGLELEPMTRG
jgi:L-fuconolactonase